MPKILIKSIFLQSVIIKSLVFSSRILYEYLRKNQINNLTEENSTKIKVFGNDDESLKILGQLLSNETSRKIISCLNGNEMYINQISKACGIQMNLVIHHIKKLEEVGLVTITEKPIVRKGVDHKFYKMVPNVFVNTTQTKEEMKENGFFKKFFKDGIKFMAIIIAAITSFKITEPYEITHKITIPTESQADVTPFSSESINGTASYVTTEIIVGDVLSQFFITGIIITLGLFLILINKKRKKSV